MNSNDKGEFGITIYTMKDQHLEPIFSSDRYHTEYRFMVEYMDCYKIGILNVGTNKNLKLTRGRNIRPGTGSFQAYHDLEGRVWQ